MIVGRLAPSPTGAQHLGNARTYLIAWLAARAVGGRVILRIEDIDSPRVKPWATAQAIEDLRWLGLDWDEGPDIGGPQGPYIQTDRMVLYQRALEQLQNKGLLYPCSCSRTDIAAAASAPHAGDEGPIYPGTCAGWQAGDLLPAACDYCWRFRAGPDLVTFEDHVNGKRSWIPQSQLGDFPVTRKGGAAAYQLAVVVDDAAMGVNQVVRGDDLLPSAVRQIELYRALELPIPQFVHLPLVVGTDGRRLAKRHGDTRLSQYREAGLAAEAIVGWAAWSIGLVETRRPIAAVELIGTFEWSRIDVERGRRAFVESDLQACQ